MVHIKYAYVLIFYTLLLIVSKTQSLHLIQLAYEEVEVNYSKVIEGNQSEANFTISLEKTSNDNGTTKQSIATDNPLKIPQGRRSWIQSEENIDILERANDRTLDVPQPPQGDDKDDNLKLKIKSLVEQTIYDTNRKLENLDTVKAHYTEYSPYRVGYLLSMLQKTKMNINELFNVAMRHRDDWKALEQLKVFESITHTSTDARHLIRQIIDLHITHMNTTNENYKKFLMLK